MHVHSDSFIVIVSQVAADGACEFLITGLVPGEKYVFAVGAYTACGQLIGKSVGESTNPILASHPMSMLMAWNYLCQVDHSCFNVIV